MQNKEKNKFTAFFKSYGFYLSLLAVCTAVASVGYFTSLTDTESGNTESLSPSEEVSLYAPTVPSLPPALSDTQDFSPEASSVSYSETGNTEISETAAEEITVEYSLPSFGEITAAFDNETLTFSEYFDDWRVHDAIDFDGNAAPEVYAAADGVVEKIYTDDKYGLTIILSHTDGCTTSYSSLESADNLSAGDKVARGEIIGMAGDSCAFEAAQGKHLHFTAVKDGKTVAVF